MIDIFISHAIKDKEIADAFIDIILHGAMSIELSTIFCTSTEGTKIKSGENWRDTIKDALVEAKVTFLIITPNYKESEMCLNEMGAAWFLSSHVLPTIVEPITFRTVGVIPEVTQVKKLLDEIHLDDLRDSVQAALAIPSSRIASGRWTQKKREFIKRVKEHIEDNPFPVAMDRKLYDRLLQENDNLNDTVDNLIEEKGQLNKQIKELEKTKDAKEVKTIKFKYKSSALFEEFEELCSDIYDDVFPFEPIIRGMIYKSFNGKQITVDWQQGYRYELEMAEANNFIKIDEEDGSVDIDWETTLEMKALKEKLNHLNEFMEGATKEDFLLKYKEKYSATFRIDNKTFWNTVLKLPLFLT
ncbi:toll/interleukin-1 receptor domain-containing protein [Parafilimonas sp.]|uniref:toll/interleukin-1 receptor domain-containing protein n=1 Tax=Parafilimonas sp. TaxID=1969739 RepID=UPI003F8144E5